MSADLIAQFQASAEAEEARCARLASEGIYPVPALQMAIDEELDHVRGEFGEDERLPPLAVTLAVLRVLDRGDETGDREELIEAEEVRERLEAGEAFSSPSWLSSSATSSTRRGVCTVRMPFFRHGSGRCGVGASSEGTRHSTRTRWGRC